MRYSTLLLITLLPLAFTLQSCKSKTQLDAEQGHASAQYQLGMQYANGEGLEVSNIYAYMWWSFSAAQGFEKANISKLAIEKKMSSSEIQAAKKLSKDCEKKYYIDC